MPIENAALSILVHSSAIVPSGMGLPAENAGNLVLNPGFESAFTNWTQDTDSGNATISIGTATPAPHEGAGYCEIYSVNGGDVDGSVSQSMTVYSGTTYRLSVRSRASAIFASMQGRWAVYDNTNAAWIVTREGTSLFSADSWQEGSLYFRTPATCTSIKLYLYQNFDGDSTVYYDSVSIIGVNANATGVIEDYNEHINSYTHSSTVNIGYDTMSMDIAGDLQFLSEWLVNGLGRHVVVKEASFGTVWEGFVNRVSMQIGGFTMAVGPYKDIISRGRIVYNQLDWATTPAIGGDTVMGPWLDNSDSMDRYGILEGVISGGEGDADEMLSLLNYLMRELSWAPSEGNFSLAGGSGQFSAKIECLGYGHLLDKYYYTRIVSGEVNASDKIISILDRNPNNLYSYSEFSTIVENTVQVEAYDDGTKTALAILKDIANLSGLYDSRYIFGVYADRIFSYGPASYSTDYTTDVSDGRIERVTGGFIDPWEVMPGKWLKVLGVGIGTRSPFIATRLPDSSVKDESNLRNSEDPTKIFIEGVSYTAPYGLSITSGRASTFRQKLDRLGLGGM